MEGLKSKHLVVNSNKVMKTAVYSVRIYFHLTSVVKPSRTSIDAFLFRGSFSFGPNILGKYLCMCVRVYTHNIHNTIYICTHSGMSRPKQRLASVTVGGPPAYV